MDVSGLGQSLGLAKRVLYALTVSMRTVQPVVGIICTVDNGQWAVLSELP
jgi:hypothetical protein